MFAFRLGQPVQDINPNPGLPRHRDHLWDPASLLCDNAAVFTGAPRRHGRVALEVTLAARGIRFNHSRPTTRRPTA